MKTKRKQPEQKKPKGASPVRLRHVVAIFVLLCAGIALPLIVVWKAASSTGMSMDKKVLADSAAILRRDAERLRIESLRLSQTSRIETIARQNLGLEYPHSQQIVIVPAHSAPVAQSRNRSSDAGFFAILRRSLWGANS